MTASASTPPLAAAGPRPLRELRFAALGTDCFVRHTLAGATADDLEHAVRSWVERFEARYSRFRPTSLVSQINAAAGQWVAVDAEMEQFLDLCGTLHRLTEGILDPTTGPLLRLWNYKQPPPTLPDAAQVDAARRLVGWPLVERRRGAVRLQPGMSLDFGGWGKEWAVDAVAQLAQHRGARDVLIDFGHDIRGLGTPPGRPAWHVGLEDPHAPGTHRSSVALNGDRGIASSGDYIRAFTRDGRRYGHIVDPRTGWPVDNGVRQVTVIAENCFIAGLLSTTAFVLGPRDGLEFIQRFPRAEGLIVTTNATAQTRGFWNHVVT